jgi:hypothetical protein
MERQEMLSLSAVETLWLLVAGNSFIFPERMLDAVPRSLLLSKHPASEDKVEIPDMRHLTHGVEQLFGRFPFFSERMLDVIFQSKFLRK